MFELAFVYAPGIGPKTFQALLKTFGSSGAAWNATSKDYKNKGFSDKLIEKLEKFKEEFNLGEKHTELERKHIQFIGFEDKYYPESLKKLSDPPIGLFVKGNINLVGSDPSIAVVGTRKATSYGRLVTEQLVSGLVTSGFTIVSGLALGIDGIAHSTCLDSGGKTIAVLGCGVDCPTPRENQSLYERILKNRGLIISEYIPGTVASVGTFPARNRIIAALSLGVLVTEAAEDSGSLITASNAASLGKPVFAVPGPITSKLSEGSLKLLKSNAKLVQTTNDILEAFEMKQKKKSLADFDGTPEEKRILEILMNESLSIDDLSKITKIPIAKLGITLSEMELNGLIKQENGQIKPLR